MKKIFNYIAVFICVCFCFLKCSQINNDFNNHQNRIEEIKIITIDGDTVLIKSHGTGHMIILPV